jgi:CheY-like chemotaxis protein
MPNQRLLIVDDEENIRDVMRMALEVEGYRVETAADGPEALRRFGNGSAWDLVLLDQRMPGMSGLEVLRRMRAIRPEGRIVMVTAYGTIDLAVNAMKAGARDFLRKPFTPEVLRGAVHAALVAEAPVAPTPAAPGPTASAPSRPPGEPLVTWRTMNGYTFWPEPTPLDSQLTDALRIRRLFTVRAPRGERRECAVDITTSVQELIRAETARVLPPEHELWDIVCNGALADYLWREAALPPENLVIYELSRQQMDTVRRAVGVLRPFWGVG